MQPCDFSKQDSAQLLGKAMLFGASGMIERQEALGQHQLVNSTTLPKQTAKDWEVLQRWGIKRGQDVDNLFCEAELPEGWKKAPTDHIEWSNLLDERGLKRARIFYKAAFYDRDAFIQVNPRFGICKDYEASRQDATIYFRAVVQDYALDRVVARFEPVRMAYLKQDQSIIGVVLGDDFFYGASSLFHSSNFTRNRPVSDATVITRAEFYEDYHGIGNGEFPTINAANDLAIVEAKKFLFSLPTDDTIWSERYDMAEV